MAAAALVYTGDTVHLKSDENIIGVVDRTFTDLQSHRLNVHTTYPWGIQRHSGVPILDFHRFKSTGVPPRGTVLVSWCQLPWAREASKTTILIPEKELVVLDRELLVGDVVKRSAEDPMSGTVITSDIFANLIQAKPWPRDASHVTETDIEFGNFNSNPGDQLRGIPTAELKWAQETEFGDSCFVVYQDWFGKILDTYEKVTIRLANGSVVSLEDADDVECLNGHSADRVEVGEFVTTKKGNLRRGQWHYGAYDANVEPIGVVVTIEVSSMEVRWLCHRYIDQPTEEPPYELESDVLDSGELHIYDRCKRPVTRNGQRSVEHLALGIALGDKVRFRDVVDAEAKYDGRRQEHGHFKRIPRQSTLGYDINNLVVSGSKTELLVRWQDGSQSKMPSTSLIPMMNLDDEDESWPGELVFSRESKVGEDEYTFEPRSAGIVQSVRAEDRLATLKWFPDASCAFFKDSPSMAPGAQTGDLADEIHEVSLYDVWSAQAVTRRVGDMVTLVPFLGSKEQFERANRSGRYDEVHEALLKGAEHCEWVGEVISLDLDGLITVRLGASADLRDIRVPWECTMMAFASEDINDSMDLDDEEEDSMTDATGQMQFDGAHPAGLASLLVNNLVNSVWQDEQGRPIEENDADADEWEDEDYEEMDVDQPEDGMTLAQPQPVQSPRADTAATDVAPGPHQFSYDDMFAGAAQRPERFEILEGSAPADHHYSSSDGSASGARLRRIQKEYGILSSSLPAGVYVRTWESSLHLMRILILGPMGTPYELTPFFIDFDLGSGFPQEPPRAFFHSWTDGSGPINPNLYEDGKICLSLLGTWPGDDHNDTWSSKATILQVIVSLVGLVLVKQPFYNEAGFEIRQGTVESKIPARAYSERTYFKSRAFILKAAARRLGGFEGIVEALYLTSTPGSPQLLLASIDRGIEVVRRSSTPAKDSDSRDDAEAIDAPRRVSRGALIPLRRNMEQLIDLAATVLPAAMISGMKDRLSST